MIDQLKDVDIMVVLGVDKDSRLVVASNVDTNDLTLILQDALEMIEENSSTEGFTIQ